VVWVVWCVFFFLFCVFLGLFFFFFFFLPRHLSGVAEVRCVEFRFVFLIVARSPRQFPFAPLLGRHDPYK